MNENNWAEDKVKIMKRFIGGLILVFVLSVLGIFSGCEDYFDYSPYAANVDGEYKGTFEKNMNYLITADSVENDIVKSLYFKSKPSILLSEGSSSINGIVRSPE